MKKLIFICYAVLIAAESVKKNLPCPICDPNDYNPVYVADRAFISLCHLRRLQCLGKIDMPPNMDNEFGHTRIYYKSAEKLIPGYYYSSVGRFLYVLVQYILKMLTIM